jgi:hypothetical protein
MANTDAAFGLEPVLPKGGVVQTTEYYVPASDETALFQGDPVIIAGSGDAAGVPSITRATGATAARITGVVVGFRPDSSIVANGYRLASTAAYVLVCDDPEQVYEVQDDSGGGNLAVTDIGLNANLAAGTGSAATKRSGFELDTSTKATTATHQVRILGITPRADVEIGANTKVRVRINTPTETGAAGSTGV